MQKCLATIYTERELLALSSKDCHITKFYKPQRPCLLGFNCSPDSSSLDSIKGHSSGVNVAVVPCVV